MQVIFTKNGLTSKAFIKNEKQITYGDDRDSEAWDLEKLHHEEVKDRGSLETDKYDNENSEEVKGPVVLEMHVFKKLALDDYCIVKY